MILTILLLSFVGVSASGTMQTCNKQKHTRVQCDHCLGVKTGIAVACYINVITVKSLLFRFANVNTLCAVAGSPVATDLCR